MAKAMQIIVIILISLFMFSFGCLQNSVDGKCKEYDYGTVDKDQCLNYMSIWFQEPYGCYGISNMTLRGECMNSSINPDAAKTLKAKKENEQRRKSPRTIHKETPVPEIETPKKEKDGNVVEKGEVEKCMLERHLSQDVCIREVAVDKLNITQCGDIESKAIRISCISTVATKNKNPGICDNLKDTNDRNNCIYHSQ